MLTIGQAWPKSTTRGHETKVLYSVYTDRDRIVDERRFLTSKIAVCKGREKVMKTRKQWWGWAVVVAGLAFLLRAPLGVRAQDAQVAPDSQAAQGPQDSDSQDVNAQDPPGRVARLNYLEGSVSFQPAGENDWVDAVLNRPLVTGDNLWADENSRAEVHIGSTALRLGAKTGITLLEVSDRAAQIRLAQGSLIVRVRHVDDDDSYEIDTPNVAFVVMQPGDYRDRCGCGRRSDGSDGVARTRRGHGRRFFLYRGGESIRNIYWDAITWITNLARFSRQDGFDSWALDRDRARISRTRRITFRAR